MRLGNIVKRWRIYAKIWEKSKKSKKVEKNAKKILTYFE